MPGKTFQKIVEPKKPCFQQRRPSGPTCIPTSGEMRVMNHMQVKYLASSRSLGLFLSRRTHGLVNKAFEAYEFTDVGCGRYPCRRSEHEPVPYASTVRVVLYSVDNAWLILRIDCDYLYEPNEWLLPRWVLHLVVWYLTSMKR